MDLFIDIDSAFHATQAMAADGDGIAVGVQTLIKRLHESGRLKSVDGQRGKLKVRLTIEGSRLEVLHLPADVLELPTVGGADGINGARAAGRGVSTPATVTLAPSAPPPCR
jgi:hypothetical protein